MWLDLIQGQPSSGTTGEEGHVTVSTAGWGARAIGGRGAGEAPLPSGMDPRLEFADHSLSDTYEGLNLKDRPACLVQ